MRYALLCAAAVAVAVGCKDSGGSHEPPPPIHPDESTHPLAMVDPAVVTVTTEVAYPGKHYTYTITGEIHNLSQEAMIAPFVWLQMDYDFECQDPIHNSILCTKSEEELPPGGSFRFTHSVRHFQSDRDPCFDLDVFINFNARWKSDSKNVYSNHAAPAGAMPDPPVVSDSTQLTVQSFYVSHEC